MLLQDIILSRVCHYTEAKDGWALPVLFPDLLLIKANAATAADAEVLVVIVMVVVIIVVVITYR